MAEGDQGQNVTAALKTLSLIHKETPDPGEELPGSEWTTLGGTSDPEAEESMEESSESDSEQSDPEDINKDADGKPEAISPDLTRVLKVLPLNDVHTLVFDRLDTTSKLSCRFVCQQWKDLVDGVLKFSPLFYDGSKYKVLRLGMSKNVVQTLTISCLKEFKYPKNGIGFQKVHAIKLIPMTLYDDRDEKEGISESNLKKILKEFSNVEKLSLNSGALEALRTPSFLKSIPLNNLNDLEISAYNLEEPGYTICGEVLSNTFPLLRSACLNYMRDDDVDIILADLVPRFYQELFHFIARHNNLEELTMGSVNFIDERNIGQSMLVNLDPGIPQDKVNTIKKGLKEVKLTSFDYQLNCCDGMPQFPFLMELLLGQNRLTKITLKGLVAANVLVWRDAMPQVFIQCSATLTFVGVTGCICSANSIEEPFSCSSISACSKLDVFQLDICGVSILDIEFLPKQIRKLCLGPRLTVDQVNHITSNMINLERLSLHQGHSNLAAPIIPKVTIDIFKNAIKLPRLVELEILQVTSEFNLISKWIKKHAKDAISMGREKDDERHVEYILINIDRTKLSNTLFN